MSPVELALSFSVPGMAIALVAVGVWELRRQKRRGRPGTPITATYINEFTAMFYGTKRMELDHRDSMSLMREEDAQGAPPHLGVDLDRNTISLHTTPPLTTTYPHPNPAIHNFPHHTHSPDLHR